MLAGIVYPQTPGSFAQNKSHEATRPRAPRPSAAIADVLADAFDAELYAHVLVRIRSAARPS